MAPTGTEEVGGRRQAGLDDASFTPGVIGDTEVVAGGADGIRSTGLVRIGEQAKNQAMQARESIFIFFSFRFDCVWARCPSPTFVESNGKESTG